MKDTLRTIAQIVAVVVSIAALVCSVVALVEHLGKLAKNKPYTEFPPEYDDYADWEDE